MTVSVCSFVLFMILAVSNMEEEHILLLYEIDEFLLGQEELFDVFNAAKENVSRKRKRLELLEGKLITREYKKDDVLRDGKEFLTMHTLELLRTRLLHTYLNLQQQKLEVSRLAGENYKSWNIMIPLTWVN